MRLNKKYPAVYSSGKNNEETKEFSNIIKFKFSYAIECKSK